MYKSRFLITFPLSLCMFTLSTLVKIGISSINILRIKFHINDTTDFQESRKSLVALTSLVVNKVIFNLMSSI